MTDTGLDHMTPQQCAAGIHPDWAIDSEDTYSCPWCWIETLVRELNEARDAAQSWSSVAHSLGDHLHGA